jgi:hypothetical protein
MRGLLPSVWLLGATLYTGSILSLLQPFSGNENWPAPPPVRETVVAKLPPAITTQAIAQDKSLLLLTALPAKAKDERHSEWLQVGAYTTVVRSRPSAEAPPLQAYPAGRPLRVLTREGGFVRVQDLGSGQLGWVEASALVPFNGGYRQRDDRAAAPLVAAVDTAPAQAEPAMLAAGIDAPKAAAAKRINPPRNAVLAAAAAKETGIAADARERGWLGLGRKRGIQPVALRAEETGMVSMVDRAIRGF